MSQMQGVDGLGAILRFLFGVLCVEMPQLWRRYRQDHSEQSKKEPAPDTTCSAYSGGLNDEEKTHHRETAIQLDGPGVGTRMGRRNHENRWGAYAGGTAAHFSGLSDSPEWGLCRWKRIPI